MAQVLLVDDAAFMRNLVKSLLEKNGHRVIGEAVNGADASEKYQQVSPDFVMMDITMPEVDGIEGVRRIKEIDPCAKIIMCSAMGQQGLIIEAIKAGASDFVVKPFAEDRILEAINKIGI